MRRLHETLHLRRHASPLIAASALLAALVVIGTRTWSLGAVFELLTCIAAAVAAFAPLSASIGAGAALTATVIAADGPGMGAFAPLICVIALVVQQQIVAVCVVSMWYWGALLWWTGGTLRQGDSIVQYGLFWAAVLASSALAGVLLRTFLERSNLALRGALLRQRRGIARDLHDTLAHSLSLIVMRSEQARLRGRTDPADLQFITHTADRSIRELRGMMALLRGEDDGPSSEDDIWDAPPIAESIGVAQERLRAHGFIPTVAIEGNLDSIPSSADAALAKVLHEATSNIIKHAAPKSDCAIMIEVSETEAELVVTNRQRRQPLQRSEPTAPLGLTGMRERVVAIGGEFSAGTGSERWITRARLPLD